MVAKQFMTALQNYTQVEKEYRQKQRARVERQFKIGSSCSWNLGDNGTALTFVFKSNPRLPLKRWLLLSITPMELVVKSSRKLYVLQFLLSRPYLLTDVLHSSRPRLGMVNPGQHTGKSRIVTKT